MKVIEFMKSLLPNFERSRIFDDIENIRVQLTGKLKQAYANAVAQLPSKNSFKSDFAKQVSKQFENTVKPRGNTTYLDYTSKVLQLLAVDTKVFKELVEKYFERNVSADGLSFVSANVLQVINAATFVTEYARRNLAATLAYETYAAMADRSGSTPEITKAELLWLDKYRRAFFEALMLFEIKPGEMKTKLESVPDMVVAPDDYNQIESVIGGTTAIDPLAVGFIPLNYNPIYRVRLQIANYQVQQYRAMEAELEAIELRLVALKYAQNGKADPALEQEINDLTARVSDTYFKLDEMANG